MLLDHQDVEDQGEMVKGLKEKQKEFLETIRVLEKDIQVGGV